jgi:hypothetical protein
VAGLRTGDGLKGWSKTAQTKVRGSIARPLGSERGPEHSPRLGVLLIPGLCSGPALRLHVYRKLCAWHYESQDTQWRGRHGTYWFRAGDIGTRLTARKGHRASIRSQRLCAHTAHWAGRSSVAPVHQNKLCSAFALLGRGSPPHKRPPRTHKLSIMPHEPLVQLHEYFAPLFFQFASSQQKGDRSHRCYRQTDRQTDRQTYREL